MVLPVPLLGLLVGPAAVARLVVAVHVEPVERVFRRRPRTHVLQERFERIPPLADADAPAAVVLVTRVVRVLAALPHVMPGVVFGRVCSAVPDVCPAHLNRLLGRPLAL